MKILYLHYLGRVSGISVGPSVHIREFVSALEGLGHSTEICPPIQYQMDQNQQNKKEIPAAAKKYGKGLKNVLLNGKYFLKELKAIRRFLPDVLIVRYSLFNFSSLLLSKIFRIPLVYEINAPLAYENRLYQKEYVYWPWLSEAVERLMISHADRCLVVSEELKAFFVRQGHAEGHFRVVPNGVDIQKFFPADRDQTLSHQFNLKSGLTVFGFTGSFSRWHGLDSILEAFGRLVRENNTVRLILVGDGINRASIEQVVKDKRLEEYVIFTGLIKHSEMAHYLSVMDVLVAPYPKLDYFYFSPLKLFEYMAMGKPVIATDVGQISSIIQNGRNGLLYPADDHRALYETMIRLAQDSKLRVRLGGNARETMESHYTWERSAEKVADICQDISNPIH